MLFWTLLLAHIVGDFPLQIDALYRLKKRGITGVLPHVAVCTLTNIFALASLLSTMQAWTTLLALAVVHVILDHGKIYISDKLVKDNFFQFIIDQTLHILSIWFAAQWLAQNTPKPFNSFVPLDITIILIALIFASFGGVPVLHYAHGFFARIKIVDQTFNYPTFLQRIPGFFERLIATLGIFLGNGWIIMSVLVFTPRMIIHWRDKNRKTILVDFMIGLLLSIFCGLFIKTIL
jgi:hypothetical protein